MVAVEGTVCGSTGVDVPYEAVFIIRSPAVPASTVTTIVRVSRSPDNMLGMVHTPEAKLPWVTVGVPNSVTPDGNMSSIVMDVKSTGPLFSAVMV